jgi:hypothetical protein
MEMPMSLSPEPSYPSTYRYVLKLHRDSAPAQGCLIGRVENVLSGQHFHFNSVDELLAGLARDLSPAITTSNN